MKRKFILGLISCNCLQELAKVQQLESIVNKLFERLNYRCNCSYLAKLPLEAGNAVKCLKKGKFKILYYYSNIFQNRIYFTILKK